MSGKKVSDEEMNMEVAENLNRFMNKTALDKNKNSRPTPKAKSFLDEGFEDNQSFIGSNNVPTEENFADDEFEEDENQDENQEEELHLAYRKENEEEQSNFEGSSKFFKDRPAKKKAPNPLSAYFREPGIFVKLPSQGNYSQDGSIEFSVNGEIGVYPMTAKDEVWFKNPDALLNGVALEKVLESCCPDIHNIRSLPINDINVLLLGLRYSSYGKALHLKAECPKCKKENKFAVNIEDLLENISFLDAEYSLQIGQLKVYIKPYTYDSMVKATIVTFEEAKVIQVLKNEELDENDRKEMIKESFQRIHNLTLLLMSDSIIKIITPDNKTIKNKEFIIEWLEEIDRKNYNELKNKFDEMNKIGVPNNYHVECQYCKHEFKIDLAYDPATFFE